MKYSIAPRETTEYSPSRYHAVISYKGTSWHMFANSHAEAFQKLYQVALKLTSEA